MSFLHFISQVSSSPPPPPSLLPPPPPHLSVLSPHPFSPSLLTYPHLLPPHLLSPHPLSPHLLSPSPALSLPCSPPHLLSPSPALPLTCSPPPSPRYVRSTIKTCWRSALNYHIWRRPASEIQHPLYENCNISNAPYMETVVAPTLLI